jgi:hypothetical protein
MKIIVRLIFLMVILSCKNNQLGTVEITGKWGGIGIEMNVLEKETLFEFDCAHAQINSKIVSIGNSIYYNGNFTFEKGGPINIDDKPDTHPAIFRGKMQGNQIDLTISISDNNMPVLIYKLIKNETGQLHKCL